VAHTLKTSTSKGTARIVGALFLTAMVASLVGAGLLESPMTAADYLSELTAASGQVKIGVLLELINGVAVIWIALLMFPIFKQHAESSALGYVAFRLVEAMVIFAAALTPVILLTMGEGSSVGGDVLVVVRKHLVGEVTGIFFSIAAFIFYCLLYQMKLVPIWLSVWGLIAVVLIFVWNLLELVGISISVGIVFGLPIILNEVVLGIWLIIKGFESAEELPVQE
jgi:hypothetical protein